MECCGNSLSEYFKRGGFAGYERYQKALDQKSVQYGVTYAVNNNVSVGLVRADTKVDVATSKEEQITSAQIGYNLGPVALSAAVSKVDDRGASTTAGTDSKEVQFRITTAF
jgi:hypothetical protein